MTKLENKRKKMILWVMIKKSKGYKFYNLNEGNMVISRDVEFDEERAWDIILMMMMRNMTFF